MKTALVFVYGTLKRGGANAHHLAGQRFVGDTRTEPAYRLHLLPEGYPGLVEASAGDGCAVEGELWEVDGPCLAHLDALEGTAEGLYRRARVRLAPPHRAAPAQGYLYDGPVAGTPALGSRYSV